MTVKREIIETSMLLNSGRMCDHHALLGVVRWDTFLAEEGRPNTLPADEHPLTRWLRLRDVEPVEILTLGGTVRVRPWFWCAEREIRVVSDDDPTWAAFARWEVSNAR